MDNRLDNIKIGERIRSIRENMSLSREKFSEMIDISEVFLDQIERGECSLSLKTLANIIAFSGASSDFILFGDESKNSVEKKIDRILSKASDETVEFIYTIINEIYKYNKKIKND